MKKLLTLLVVPLFLLAAPSYAFDNSAFGGVYYSATDGTTEGPLYGGGVGHRISGSLWSYAYAKVGQYGTIAVELAWYPLNFQYGDSTWGSIGLIAGPNADWLNYGGDDPIVYMNTAAGVIGSFDVTPTVGFFGFGKYKFMLADTQYQDGWMAGIGTYIRL